MARGHGTIQKKILLLLLGGLALGLSGSPKQSFKIVKAIGHDWKEIDQTALRRSIRPLYKSKLISTKSNKDGMQTIMLTEKGKRWALTYKIETMHILIPKKWDKKWRIVMFDIPERLKKTRDVFRIHLRSMGFLELQRSVFIHPYPCIDEIEYVVEHYNIGKHVRFIVADSIDNEQYLKRRFDIVS